MGWPENGAFLNWSIGADILEILEMQFFGGRTNAIMLFHEIN